MRSPRTAQWKKNSLGLGIAVEGPLDMPRHHTNSNSNHHNVTKCHFLTLISHKYHEYGEAM